MNKQTADDLVKNTGALALLYYPEITADDPDYDLAADIEALLEPVTEPGERVLLRDVIARVVMDPTGTRDEFAETVFATLAEG